MTYWFFIDFHRIQQHRISFERWRTLMSWVVYLKNEVSFILETNTMYIQTTMILFLIPYKILTTCVMYLCVCICRSEWLFVIPLLCWVCRWLATGQWFSPGTPVSSNNKTNCHYIIEILLKVALNTITPLPPLLWWILKSFAVKVMKTLIQSNLL